VEFVNKQNIIILKELELFVGSDGPELLMCSIWSTCCGRNSSWVFYLVAMVCSLWCICQRLKKH